MLGVPYIALFKSHFAWQNGWIAELWNTIKLHYKKFHTQSRLQKLTREMIRVDQKPPKQRAKGAETRHLVPCCHELATDFHEQQRSAHSLTVCGAVRQCCVRQVLSPVLHPLQSFVQGGLRRQPVEAEAEDAHGPRDVRGAVRVGRQPARILDLQGRELHGRRFVHGALARWISDGFDDSSPCVGHTSHALALMIGCERAIGKKKKKLDTEQTHLRHTPHDTNTKQS